ncbi:pseudouridine synthase [Alloprevotella tannerae]
MSEELENKGFQERRSDEAPSSEQRQDFGHTPRPRFNRNARIGGYSNNYNRNQESNGPRQRFNAPNNNGYRPRYNDQRNDLGDHPYSQYNNNERSENDFGRREDNYRPRNNYGQNNNNGYRPRFNGPRYNNSNYNNGQRYNNRENRENAPSNWNPNYRQKDYQQNDYRQGDFQQGGYRQNGYRPRPNYGDRQQGNFQRRPQQRRPYNPNAKYSLKKQIAYKEEHVDPNEPIRLNRYLANAGICSRRDADKYIQAGVITVNGKVVTELGTKVLRSDDILFHESPVRLEKKVYVLLNKPKGCITTSEDPQERKTVMNLVKGACQERIYPVGRLDRNTTGVLLLTNDGELAAKLTHPQFMKKKIYHVYLDKNVSGVDMQKIAEGITLDDGEIKADDIQYASETDKKQVGIEIHSGKNRIVRRIFESLGYHVVKLDRVYFAGLTKKHLRRGDWRYLTQDEVNYLRMGAFE